MTYNLVLTVTQKWIMSVEADNLDEAKLKALVEYEACPNPWGDERFLDEQPETVTAELIR